MLINDALNFVGIGKYHIRYYGVTALLLNVFCIHLYLNIFLLQDPDKTCKIPAGQKAEDFIPPLNKSGLLGGQFEACRMYNYSILGDGKFNIDKNTLISCPEGYEFLDKEMKPTMLVSVGMLCNRDLANIFPSLASIAVWPSQPIFIQFMDLHGRKSCISICMLISALLVIITPQATTFWTAYTLRCVARIFSQVGYLAITRHIVESHAVEQRIESTTLIVSAYTAGLPTLALLQYLVKSDSATLDYIVGIASLVATLCCVLWFHESPLFWVINARREVQAEKIIRKMAYYNGIELPEDFRIDPSPLFTIAIERMPPRWHTWSIKAWNKVMGNPYIFGRWFYVAFTWFTINLVWVACSVNRTTHPTDFIWNFAIIGFSCMLGGFSTTYVMRVLKKMEIMCLYLLIISIPFFIDTATDPGGLWLTGKIVPGPADVIRGVFYAIGAGLAIPAMAVLRLQSSEIRGEECQPGAIMWMLFFGTTGGALGMYYIQFMRIAWSVNPKLYMWVPFSFGMICVLTALMIRVCFYHFDYVEDLRWRDSVKRVFRRKRVTPAPKYQRRKTSVIEDPILGCSLLNNTC